MKRICVLLLLGWSILFGITCPLMSYAKDEDTETTELTTQTSTEDVSTEYENDVYNRVKQDTEKQWNEAMDKLTQINEPSASGLEGFFIELGLKIVRVFQASCVVVCPIAIVIGVIMIAVSGTYKTLRRTGYTVAIGVPLVYIIVMFGLRAYLSNLLYG